ncbi:MAG: hypothetical protein LIO93_08495 [Bacteroidales bacterium]|nr:hypothetical protein [Bacteroidales bacterium]
MARTIETIHNQMIELKKKDAILDTLNSESATAIWRLWSYIVAVAIWTLEKLFDIHREEMEQLYSEHHAHTLEWYSTRAKGFMLGKAPDELQPMPFSWKYDTTGMTEKEIEDAKIITYASCTKAREANNRIVLELKVASGTGGTRKPLKPEKELEPFRNYMERNVQDAGVDLRCVSMEADRIKMKWTVYYDPQILDKNGNRLDGEEPNVVKNAIIAYLSHLPFNELYVPTYHVDYVQQIEGVKVPVINWVKSSRYTEKLNEATFTDVPEKGRIAAAGWFKFPTQDELWELGEDDYLQIEMIPFTYGQI